MSVLSVSLSCAENKPSAVTNTIVRGVANLPLEQRRAFLRGTLSDWRINTDMKRGVKPPPVQKPCSEKADFISLVPPDKFEIGNLSVRKAIKNRRSRRVFSTESFSLEELSYLLWSTQGVSGVERDEDGNITAQYRTVPSGGGRHPFETYLVINRVQSVKPGLYRYLPMEHKLMVIMESPDFAGRIMASCYGQECVGTAAVVFVWTTIPYRTEWKYGGIASKMIAVEAGHVCQNLYLAAESVKGAVCAVMGYDQKRMDNLLHIDGKDEFVIYLAVTGKPVEEN
ncbi:MAG: SagB/ThcOx family dehydrogenase [Kiritimatiellia bacterium]